MSNLNLNNLISNKNEILKAEIGALLFNLGKTHAGFSHWKNYFPNATQLFSSYKDYYQKNHFKNELVNTDNKLKDFIFNKKVKLPDGSAIDWKEFFFGDVSSEDFIKKVFFRGCENINSGIDKGSPKEDNKLKELYISNAFGSFKYKPIKDDLDKSRECFFQNFHRFLEDNNYYNFPEWNNIREFVLENVKTWYSRLLSDSRFPVNDVTLRDQAYITDSMFKATLSGLFLENSNFQNYITNPQTIKWSILGIQYDKLTLSEKGLKAASIKWYRETSEKVDNEIKKLLEIDYPIGNEVYRDETGIYFVVSENLIGSKSGDFYKLHGGLDEVKNNVQEIFKADFQGEVYPAIFLTKPSRGLMNLGYLVEKAKENFLKAEIPDDFVSNLKSQYDSNPEGICQICKLRLANKDEKDDLICDVCKKRRDGRIDEWINNLDKETIWLDELQDKNGRVALITLKFELDKWINGDLVNSLVVNNCNFSQILNSLFNDLKTNNGRNKKLKNTAISDYVDKSLRNRINLEDYLKNILLERSIGSTWEEFICKKLDDWDNRNNKSLGNKIDFENRTIQWQSLKDSDIQFFSELLLQFLLRKNPSPARLRRIWETTKEFFEVLESRLVELAGMKDDRQKRLVWNNINIPDGEYQDGDILFRAKGGNVYLITSIERIGNKRELKLKKDKDNNSNVVPTLKKENANKQIYKPCFRISSPTPISWQFIIPAENVPELVKNIQIEYYKNFKWVYGKLPLHIGVVIQNYKRPLYIGIKALRKIRRDNPNWFDLRSELYVKEFKARQKKAFHYQQLPEKVSDCENLYSLFEKINGEGRYEFYLYPDKGEKQKIDTIKEPIDTTQNSTDTEKFYFYPNTFDFEFLDTNTRRNDIFYKKAKRFLRLKQNRPYNIDYWQYFEKFKEYFKDKKTSSKLQKLISLIYSKIEDWDILNNLESTVQFQNFIISSFINILELNDEEKKNRFSAILGIDDFNSLKKIPSEKFIEKILMLIDMFEFWHTALKFENNEGGKNE